MEKVEYNRASAFAEFEWCYKYAYDRISEPRKWLKGREIALLKIFDEAVRSELDATRDSEADVLSMHCDMPLSDDMEKKSMRMIVYWLIEESLERCPGFSRYYCERAERPLGVEFAESCAGLSVNWKIDLKECYSKEVWS